MGGGGHAREKDHQNVKSLIIFARDCRWFPAGGHNQGEADENEFWYWWLITII